MGNRIIRDKHIYSGEKRNSNEFNSRCYNGKIHDNKDNKCKFIFTYNGFNFPIIAIQKIPPNGSVIYTKFSKKQDHLLRTIRRHQFILQAHIPINCEVDICGYIINDKFYNGLKLPIKSSITLVAKNIKILN